MEYIHKADSERSKLKKLKTIEEFTIPSLLEFFKAIYRNQYYTQDPWKIAMHVYEELGEATTELGRLELALQGLKQDFSLNSATRKAKADLHTSINETTEDISDDITVDPKYKRNNLRNEMKRQAGLELKMIENRQWKYFVEIVSLRFKEEIADVFSWLVAIIKRLTQKDRKDVCPEIMEIIRKDYVGKEGRTDLLKCDWCNKKLCEKKCLPSHEIYEEILELVLKF